ncbi:Rad2 nuclease [Chamberlinius hualienensis]
MGINGLLRFLQPASHHTNIRNYSGCTVAVDTYCWLHRGAFSCADKLAIGEATNGYVVYCMKMVNSLIAAGVRPILVFDGQNLPSKAETERKRHHERQNNKRIGKNYLIEGKVKEAREMFQRCTEVTFEMAKNLIKACRNIGVDCIVAPYEADSQLAYLNKIGIAQIVITEDSDLVLFGCEKIMYKMDVNGNGVMVEKSRINDCLGSNVEFSFEKFRYMCIMSGCDYVSSLSGIGLKKALKFFSKTTNPDLSIVLAKIPIYLNMPSVVVTKEYIKNFIQADNTFLYQLVFDPLKRRLVPLNPYKDDINPSELSYAGPSISNEMALQIALGNIDLDTMEKVDDYDPLLSKITIKSVSWMTNSKVNSKSIWDPNYVVHEPDCNSKSLSVSAFLNGVVKNHNKTDNTRKRPLDDEDKFNGTSNEELLSMYTDVQHSKISRSVSAVNFSDNVNIRNDTRKYSLPTLTSSNYFFSESNTSLASTAATDEEQTEIAQSLSHNGDSSKESPKHTSTLHFDENLSSSNRSKLNVSATSSDNISKPVVSPGNFGSKYKDLYTHYGYNVSERLTLSPLNHTPFKSVVSSFSPASESQTFKKSLDSCIRLSSSQPLSSQDGTSDQEHLNSSQDTGLDGHCDENNKRASLSSIKSSKAPGSFQRKIINSCKPSGLSRRQSVIQDKSDDGKRQLSIKESLAKFQFVRNTQSILPLKKPFQ